MRGQSCRFADGIELYEADLMTGQVRNLRTHLVYELKLPRQQSVWMWKSPEARKDEKDKPKRRTKRNRWTTASLQCRSMSRPPWTSSRNAAQPCDGTRGTILTSTGRPTFTSSRLALLAR